MYKFLVNCLLFIFLSIILGETIARATRLTSDIPQRTIDSNGIQKYIPNQKGYWQGSSHHWQINKLGWSGKLPQEYNNLISIIGDSYIENLMNPQKCHQNIYLKKYIPEYNFLQAARAGVTFIEALEISQSLNSFNPRYHLLYLNNNDFTESIQEIEKYDDRTQISLKNEQIIPGKLKSPGIKKVLYSWKLAYYFFNRISAQQPVENTTQIVEDKPEEQKMRLAEVEQLLDIVSEKYNVANKVLIFHPDIEPAIVRKAKQVGFEIIVLENKNEEWSFEHDRHWTCYGHERVASQVTEDLTKYFSNRIHR